MRVTCVVFFAASLSLSPMFPLGLDGEDGSVSRQQEGAMGVHWQAHKHTQPPAHGLDPFYALPVWAWRDNPHGTFVDFSPNVSCDGFVPTS
jgi:hypothetical protein